MKTIWIVLIVLIFSTFSFGKSKYPDIDRKWDRAKVEQRYKFAYQIKEAKQRSRINMIRAKSNQRVRRRYKVYNRHRKRYYRSSYRSMYSMRVSPN